MSARLLLIGSAFLVASCATAQENPNYQYSTKYGQTQVADNTHATPNMTTQASTIGTQSTQRVIHSDAPRQSGAQTYSAGTETAVTHTHVMGPNHDLTSAHAADLNHASNPGDATIQAGYPQNNNTSPTEQAYDADSMQGTPGYEMMRAQQTAGETHPSYPAAPAPTYTATPAPTYTPYTPQAAPEPLGPRQVEYNYDDNLRADDNAPTRLAAPSYEPVNDQARSGTAVNVLTGQSYTVGEGDTVYSLSRRLCAPMADITTANGIGGDYAISIGQTLYLPNSRC